MGLQSLCFTTSRRNAELVAKWASQRSLNAPIASYRAGYRPEERREIEAKFRAGELRGLASTTALELGIDIGSLDCVIISGYPGTVISTWQMAGRAGRGEKDAVIFLLGMGNPLDQYFMKHPEKFFSRAHEHAIIDVENPYVLLGHLLCAAAELPSHLDRDEVFFGDQTGKALASLATEKVVQETPAGWVYRGTSRPTEIISLNSLSEKNVQVLHDGKLLETLDLRRGL